ncbi:hypothetical protein At1g04090-like [Nymphaea colorata]|nr:hypothetical protein At1g04090-like [Nymphaea colorata]
MGHRQSSPKGLPINSTFKLPSQVPAWPPGTGFATGSISLGELEVCQVTTFTKIWSYNEGGVDNLGASFFKPASIPSGFFMLGCYCQPNSKQLSGWVLAGKGSQTLKIPVDFSLVWSSESLNIKQDDHGYFWLPIPPQGYKAVGFMVTSTPEKPPLDEIRCVRSDLVDECELDTWVWDHNKDNGEVISFYSLRPTHRGTSAVGVRVGTFCVQVNGEPNYLTNVGCLKNMSRDPFSSYMPSLTQVEAIMKVYSPWIYFHPDEAYLPSSVPWFFTNGALLYQNGSSTPTPIDPAGSNLPQGGSEDDSYWIALPVNETDAGRVKKGALQSAECYLHIKPMLGATFTDVAIWVFYPFNGPARAKVKLVNISLGKIGEHVGDWEHVTLRISNFSGELWQVYCSQHSKGTWVGVEDLEFEGGNKAVVYASLHGHALYPRAGLVLQGDSNLGIGIRNDTAKGTKMDTGERYVVVAGESLGSVAEPPWLNYAKRWGPTITYNIAVELKKVTTILPGKLKDALESVIRKLPAEVLGESGPTGPKMKSNWSVDEA